MPNPYLQDQQDSLTSQVTNNLQRNVLPGINRGAVASGGFGGSRQGIAQGLAIGETNRGLSSAIAGMQGQAYNADQDRSNQMAMTQANIGSQQQIAGMQNATNRYGLTNQYNLGLTNNQTTRDIGMANASNNATANTNNFYTQQRDQDLRAQQQGFNQYTSSLDSQLGLGSRQATIGQQQFNAPQSALTNYGNFLGQFSGLNQSSSTTSPSTGGGLAGAIGGGLTAAQLWNLINQPRP